MNSDSEQSPQRRGILLTSNLLFSSMVTGTASALGQEVAVAGDVAEAVELGRGRPCAYIIIDLSLAGMEIGEAVVRLREAAGTVPIIAFGSHVERAVLDAARAAGCNEVLPRSKFSAELPALLRRYFDGTPPD